MALLQKAYLGAVPLFSEKPWFFDNELELVDTGGTVNGILLTASGTAHTKGAWAELISSTSGESDLLKFSLSDLTINGAAVAGLIDIGVGASGSETAIIEDIAVGSAVANFNNSGGIVVEVPIKIAAGTRISARIQSNVSSRTALMFAAVFKSNTTPLIPTSVTSVGGNTATSQGVSIAANSTWTEIISSTAQDCIGFSLVPSSGEQFMGNFDVVMDIGVGASGSEQAFGSVLFRATGAETIAMRPMSEAFFPREVPAGSRIAVRQSANTTTHYATVIAVPKV